MQPSESTPNFTHGEHFPFPFFGAGIASYFEWAELVVRFKQPPAAEELQKMVASAPKPIRPSQNTADGDYLKGRVLQMGSDQFVNFHIASTYGDGKGRKKVPHESDYAGEEFFQVGEKAARLFEADIERWLKEVHATCPIEFAFRREDFEAEGTQLSEWHLQSLKAVPELIQKWSEDPYTYEQSERKLFTHALREIFDYASIEIMQLPEKLVDALFSDARLCYLLNQGKTREALNYFSRHPGDFNLQILKTEFNSRVRSERYDEANLFSEFLGIEIREEGYVQWAMQQRGNAIKSMDICLKGMESCPASEMLMGHTLYFAYESGQHEIVKKYLYFKGTHPVLIANQSFVFVKNGQLAEAFEILVNHYKKGGEMNVEAFCNLLYVCNQFKRPDNDVLDRIVVDAEQKLFTRWEFSSRHDFVSNFLIYLSDHEPARGTVIFQKFLDKMHHVAPSHWCTYTCAAWRSKDEQIVQTALDEVNAAIKRNRKDFKASPTHWQLLINIAALYSFMRNKPQMIKTLKSVREVYADFKKLKDDTDFEYYWTDRTFLKLFEDLD